MRRFWLGLLIVVFAAAACAPAATPTPVPPTAVPPTAVPPTAVPTLAQPSGVQLPEVDPLAVAGDIITAGSSTVFPLSERLAERFRDEGYKGNITIDSIGREPVEFRVGTDALAVVVSKENTFLKDVTMEQLARVFSADTVKWSDVDPSWPNHDILRFSPGTDSGTFDYFVEVVLGKKKELLLNAANLQLSEDDNVLVQGVLGSPYAIGYFGFAYYHENAAKMNVLSIAGVAPSAETVDSRTYALARPLFIYSTAKIMQEKPQVASFINFYLTNVNEEIGSVGYFPSSAEALNASRAAWLKAMGQ
jgi:phosphate transport system substrate-binding protein